MSGLFASLNTAISGLHSHQVAVNVTANNIANVDTEGYSRQRVDLVSETPMETADGLIGRGVGIGAVTRARNELLDTVYRFQSSSLGSSTEQQRVQTRMEDMLFEPSDRGLTSLLDDFFGAFQELAAKPEEQPLRTSAVNSTVQLAASISDLETNLDRLRTDADREIRALTTDVNTLLEQIAEMNDQISDLELGSGHSANDLRDRRGVLLDKLSEIMNITTVETSNGSVSLSVEGIQLVAGSQAYNIEAVVNPALDPVRKDFVELVVTETGAVLNPSQGQLAGLTVARDTLVASFQSKLDAFTKTLISETNLIHAQGRGLDLFDSVTGATPVAAGTTSLDLADPATGLEFPPSTGSFEINVVDGSYNVATTTISVDTGAGDSLLDIAGSINAVGNITASVVDDTLQITAGSGYTFGFSNDTSGFLAAVGINTLFTGSGSRDIAVNEQIENDVAFLAVGSGADPRETGDNSNAVALGELQSKSVDITVDATTTSISMPDYLRTSVSDVGVMSQRIGREVESEQMFVKRLDTRREEVSGVSVNEEVANLIRFQRGFDASARMIRIVDEMLQTLIQSI